MHGLYYSIAASSAHNLCRTIWTSLNCAYGLIAKCWWCAGVSPISTAPETFVHRTSLAESSHRGSNRVSRILLTLHVILLWVVQAQFFVCIIARTVIKSIFIRVKLSYFMVSTIERASEPTTRHILSWKYRLLLNVLLLSLSSLFLRWCSVELYCVLKLRIIEVFSFKFTHHNFSNKFYFKALRITFVFVEEIDERVDSYWQRNCWTPCD